LYKYGYGYSVIKQREMSARNEILRTGLSLYTVTTYVVSLETGHGAAILAWHVPAPRGCFSGKQKALFLIAGDLFKGAKSAKLGKSATREAKVDSGLV